MRRFPLLSAALCLALPAAAVEVADDTVLLGLDAGLGNPQAGAGNALGSAALLGGQFVYHPMGEWGLGLQVERFDFKSKGGNKADMSSVLALGRANIETDSDLYLPYLLIALGWAQSRADVSGGTDRGSGVGFALGVGMDRFLLERRLSLGVEFRLHRLGAPLPRLGLSGATVMALALRLDLWLEPDPSPFRGD